MYVNYEENFKDGKNGEYSDEDAAGLEFSDRDTFFSFLALNFFGDKAIAEFLLPSKNNQERLLADPEKIQTLKDLIWTIWPFSKRRDGFYNDYEEFSNSTKPAGGRFCSSRRKTQ